MEIASNLLSIFINWLKKVEILELAQVFFPEIDLFYINIASDAQ